MRLAGVLLAVVAFALPAAASAKIVPQRSIAGVALDNQG